MPSAYLPPPLLSPASLRGQSPRTPQAGHVAVAATCRARPPLADPQHPERPLPEPEMWTRSGRPLLEHDDRSLWERPRGLGSPGSRRRAGGGADASGSGPSAATCPTGTPGDSAELLPASAMGSAAAGRERGVGQAPSWGPGSVGCAVGALGDPEAARREGRLDARHREAGREGGRRKRTESLHRKEPPTACSRSRRRKPQG